MATTIDTEDKASNRLKKALGAASDKLDAALAAKNTERKKLEIALSEIDKELAALRINHMLVYESE